MLEMDKSTLDLNALHKLPAYVKPESYTIDRSLGSCCHGDPPGYPSYFLQHVYTKYGNSPSKGATMLIQGRIVETADQSYEKLLVKLRKLWNPLPYNHPRVRAWVVAVYKHMHGCYKHPDYTKNEKMEILTGPSHFSEYFRLKAFHDDVRFSEEWREKAKAEVNTHNIELHNAWAKVCKPENHAAYLSVREFYPEHEPDLALIENPPHENGGDWWEVLDHKPSPEECPGTARWGRSGRPHPSNGESYCQMCGWRPAFEKAAVK
jgi:hypothetical protein